MLTQKRHLGRNKEVFDAELYDIYLALSIALRARYPRAQLSSRAKIQRLSQLKRDHVWLDSRAALSRIQHLAPGLGQWLARRIYDYIDKLIAAVITVEIH